MKRFIEIWCLISMPIIAWLPAKFWILKGNLWCLAIYPEWLDRYIYSIAAPYLAEEMTAAAEQMEFIEVWLASAIILETISIVIIFLYKDKL